MQKTDSQIKPARGSPSPASTGYLARITAAVAAEEELPGEMPGTLRAAIMNAIAAEDWHAIEEYFRDTVRVCKRNITRRIEAELRPDNRKAEPLR